MSRPLAMLCLIASMAISGANMPLAKMLVAAIPPDVLLLLRFVLASAVLALIVPLETGPRLRSLNARQWGAVAVLGIIGSVLFTWAVLEGVRRTSGSNAGIIMAALPAVVALFGVALGERLRRSHLSMIVLAVCGVAMIQGHGPDSTANGFPDQIVGNLLIGVAVVCEAAFIIAARRISTVLQPIRLSLGVALVSLVACLPTGIIGLYRFDAATVEPKIWALLVWYTLTTSFVCTVLWYRAVGHVDAWAAGLTTAAVPVAALAMSVLVLGERLGPAQAAGAALVIAAIVLGTLSSGRPNKAPATRQ